MKLIIAISLLAISFFAQAQTDSTSFAQATWSNKKLAKGINWKSYHFQNNTLFNASENINIVYIGPKAKKHGLHVAYSDSLERTSVIGQRTNAIAAINGSFFRMRGPDPDHTKETNGKVKLERSKLDINRSTVYMRVNDSVISKNIPDKDNLRKRHQEGSVAIDHGRIAIVKDSASLDWENNLQGEDVLSTGPVMILQGVDQRIPNDAFCNDRHPRTAIGTLSDGTVLLLVVDGRAKESAGVSIPELQSIMRWLGCTEAINLDGGGSSAMYIRGEPFNGVVNYPTDNKKFDHEGEREVANAIILTRK